MEDKTQSQLDAEKITRVLGLNGDDAYKNPNHFYNVSDVLICLMNWFDHKKEDDDFNTDFETHLEAAREAYEYDNKDWNEQKAKNRSKESRTWLGENNTFMNREEK